jgi:Tfp pilus assembly protein PilW
MVNTAPSIARAADERGFSLVELMIVALISSAVIGSAVMLASQVQGVYTHELDDAAVQQEARYALDWMARTLAPAGSNPYGITTSACPAAGTAFAALRLDPDGDGIHDDVRIQADVNPPNGVLLGLAGACTEQGEDVTIAHDPAALTLTQRDMAVAGGAVPVTDGIFTQLLFTYLTTNRTVTTTPGAIAYVRIDLTARSRGLDIYTGQFDTFTYRSEVRVRAR